MYLYKFSNVEISKLACLQANLIWFAALGSCNDPFEGIHLFSGIGDHDAAQKNINKIVSLVISNTFQVSAKDLEDRKKKELIDIMLHGLLSMSQHCDKKKPNLNNLMWSHYADGMKGYCLKFNKEKFISSIYKVSDSGLIEDLYCKPVNYVKNIPQINWLAADDIKNAIFSKSDHWEHENEYRLTSLSTGKHSYDPDSLEEVIIGYKMPLEQQLMIFNITIACNSGITFKEATLSQDSYEVKIIDFDHEEKLKKIKEISHERDKIIKETAVQLISRDLRKGWERPVS